MRQIRQYRQQGRTFFYLDETWLNEGHNAQKVWQDESITSRRQAFLEGWFTGLRNPSGKGRRLIITYNGGDMGFVDGGLLVFKSRKTGDYHEDMNAKVFEEWFEIFPDKLPKGSIVVTVPTTSWRKTGIQDWLKSKGIEYGDE